MRAHLARPGIFESAAHPLFGARRLRDVAREGRGCGLVGVTPRAGLPDGTLPVLLSDVPWLVGSPRFTLCHVAARIDSSRHLGALALQGLAQVRRRRGVYQGGTGGDPVGEAIVDTAGVGVLEAAAQLEFEKAAALRDEIAKIRKL